MTSAPEHDNGSAVLESLDPACHTAEPPRQEDITEVSREETEEEKLERRRVNRREINRRWRERNREKVVEGKRRWRQRNAAKIAEQKRQYQILNAERIKLQRAEYRKNNRELAAKRTVWRLKNDPNYRITHVLRSRVWCAITRAKGSQKRLRTMELIGCSLEFLRAHIASQFSAGMSWENQGKWHIDHIRPCSSFDMLDEAQQKECFHYSNLRPLWAADNIRKHNKITDVKMRQALLFNDKELQVA